MPPSRQGDSATPPKDKDRDKKRPPIELTADKVTAYVLTTGAGKKELEDLVADEAVFVHQDAGKSP